MKNDLKNMRVDALKDELQRLKEHCKRELNRERRCYLLVRQCAVALEILERRLRYGEMH
jgi:hypothetical protein